MYEVILAIRQVLLTRIYKRNYNLSINIKLTI